MSAVAEHATLFVELTQEIDPRKQSSESPIVPSELVSLKSQGWQLPEKMEGGI